MSQAQCEARNPDFGEKYKVFEQMVGENPALVQTIMSSPDPAQHAYDLAKQHMFQAEVGADPAGYRAKLEAEIRAEIEAEYKNKNKVTADLAASLPPSAASLADKVPVSGVQNDSLDELFPGQVQS